MEASTSLRRMLELAPFSDETSAARALTSVLATLAERLTVDERRALHDALPSELQPLLAVDGRGRRYRNSGFFASVAGLEGVRLGLAVEHVSVVCGVLGEWLSDEVRARLQRAVPELSGFFDTPLAGDSESPRAEGTLARPNSLANGRPGSRHPLASSAPPSTTHEHSVVSSDEPHGQTKLSSAIDVRGARGHESR